MSSAYEDAMDSLGAVREAAPDEAEAARIVELIPASSVRIEETSWMWANRVPLGGVTLLVGQEGTGKTTILGDVLAKATRGQLEGDLDGIPVGAVYATAEDSWSRTLVPRLAAAGADLDRVHFVAVDGLAGGLTVPDDLAALANQMQRTGSRVLVLDPLGAHLEGRLDTAMRRFARRLRRSRPIWNRSRRLPLGSCTGRRHRR